MNRADLVEKARAEKGEDAVRLDQNTPEAVGEIVVIGGMPMVGLEADRMLDFTGQGPDPHIETERAHSPHQLGMEIGDRPRLQGKGFLPAVIDADPQAMLDKVEIDLKGVRAVGDRRGGKTAAGDVERHLPPVIDHWRLRQADLADDLRPYVECGAGFVPACHWQTRGTMRSDVT
jgi:hypothetical protein